MAVEYNGREYASQESAMVLLYLELRDAVRAMEDFCVFLEKNKENLPFAKDLADVYVEGQFNRVADSARVFLDAHAAYSQES